MPNWDQEFGAIEALQHLDQWHGQHVLRQKSSQGLRPDANTPWQAFGTVIHKGGQCVWLGEMDD
jgi:hypothetical protein